LTARCFSAPFFWGQKHHTAQAPSMNHNQNLSHGASEFWLDTLGLHAIHSLF